MSQQHSNRMFLSPKGLPEDTNAGTPISIRVAPKVSEAQKVHFGAQARAG